MARIRCICCRKVFRFMVELSAGRLGGAVDAMLRAELLRCATQAVQPAHRSSAHLTIEILSIDSRLCLAEDDHPLLRHGLLSREEGEEKEKERSSNRRRSIEKRLIRVRAHRAHVTRQTTHVARATRHARFPPDYPIVLPYLRTKLCSFHSCAQRCHVSTMFFRDQLLHGSTRRGDTRNMWASSVKR